MPEVLLTQHDVSLILGRAESTLEKDRLRGCGVPFIKIGRMIRYRQADVDAWLAARPTMTSTSQADAERAA